MDSPAVERHVLTLHQFRPAAALQAFCRFHAIPFRVANSAYPRFASHGDLPYVQHGSVFVGADRALSYLRRVAGETGVEESLTDPAAAAAEALASLLRGPLATVETWCLHHADADARACARTLPLPLAWFVPRAQGEAARQRLAAAGMVDEAWVRHVAVTSWRALAATLASNTRGPFFAGTSPGVVDALVYGHLEAVRHTAAGAWIVESAPALCEFYAHIRRVYFTQAAAGAAGSPRAAPEAVAGTRHTNTFEALSDRIDAEVAAAAAAAGAGAGAGAQSSAAERFFSAPPAVVRTALSKLSEDDKEGNSVADKAGALGVALLGAAAAAAVYATSV
jgi:hypothetical protein